VPPSFIYARDYISIIFSEIILEELHLFNAHVVITCEYPSVQSDLEVHSMFSLIAKRTSLWNKIKIIFEPCYKVPVDGINPTISHIITKNFLYRKVKFSG